MDVGVIKNDKAVAIDLGGQEVTASITSTRRPLLAIPGAIPGASQLSAFLVFLVA